MNADRLKGNWRQLRGKVREQWGKLIDDDLDVIHGRQDQLIGRVQRIRGKAREEAEKEVAEFFSRQ